MIKVNFFPLYLLLILPNYLYGQKPTQSFNFTADLNTDLILGKSLQLLSAANYDNYLFSLFIMDLDASAKQYNLSHELGSQFKVNLRTKNIMGNNNNFSLFQSQPIKIGIGRTESEFAPNSNYLLAWFREAWFEYIFNHKYHSQIRLGYFPYQIGQGIALGNAYRLGDIVAGMEQLYYVDQFRPSLSLSGDFIPNRLGYDFYLGLINQASTNLLQTGQITQDQNPYSRTNPYRGSMINNLVFSAQFNYAPKIKHGKALIRPYLILNSDNQQQIEYLGDAFGTLGIVGWQANLHKNNLTINIESALNFGSQSAKSWDRDIVLFNSKPYHLYLFQNFGTTNNPFWMTAQQTPVPENLSYQFGNGTIFTDELGTQYLNAYNRYRHNYQNHYHGFFLTIDLDYQLNCNEQSNSRLGLSAGFITGGQPPNDSIEKLIAYRLAAQATNYQDFSKSYTGFTGIQQLYVNNTVPSFFMMEVQKLNLPISSTNSLVTYPQITNLSFIGFGSKYQYNFFKRKLDSNLNFLLFYTPIHEIKGFNYGLNRFFELNSTSTTGTELLLPSLQTNADTILNSYLGLEINGSFYLNLNENFQLYTQAACFIPGKYYDQNQGKIIRLTEQFKLAATDYSGYENNNQKYAYTLGNSLALFLNIGCQYLFSS